MRMTTAMILAIVIASLMGCALTPEDTARIHDGYLELEDLLRVAIEQDALVAQQKADEAQREADIAKAEAEASANARADTTTSGGYVWKPVSEGDRKLVVLFPNALKGKIESGEIHSALPPTADTLIEKGRFSGDTHNGNRPHYRYSKPGNDYGVNLFSVAVLKDGTYKSYSIPNGGKREDK